MPNLLIIWLMIAFFVSKVSFLFVTFLDCVVWHIFRHEFMHKIIFHKNTGHLRSVYPIHIKNMWKNNSKFNYFVLLRYLYLNQALVLEAAGLLTSSTTKLNPTRVSYKYKLMHIRCDDLADIPSFWPSCSTKSSKELDEMPCRKSTTFCVGRQWPRLQMQIYDNSIFT